MSMTSEAFDAARSDYGIDDLHYQPVPAAAVASVILSLLSITMFLAGRDSLQASLMLAPLPLCGLAIGLRALRRIQESRGQIGGRRVAWTGILTSAFCLFGGVGFAGYVYATELPPGYERVSFVDLAPDEVEARGGVAVPDEIAALDGKKVFIKGYMRPDSTPVSRNVKRFLLVRDSNNCCFGDISTVKYYDQIGVEVAKGIRLDYRTGLFRMGGVFRVHPQHVGAGAQRPVFTLDADYVQ